MTVTVVVGNPRPASRTLAAAITVATDIRGVTPDNVLDLASLGPKLFDYTDVDVDGAVNVVRQSDLVVVASPVYKATYTGLLKLFLERFGAGELRGVVAIPVLVGAAHNHALAVETHLRPLLVEIGFSTPTRGLFLIDSSGTESDAYQEWLVGARAQLSGTAG